MQVVNRSHVFITNTGVRKLRRQLILAKRDSRLYGEICSCHRLVRSCFDRFRFNCIYWFNVGTLIKCQRFLNKLNKLFLAVIFKISVTQSDYTLIAGYTTRKSHIASYYNFR